MFTFVRLKAKTIENGSKFGFEINICVEIQMRNKKEYALEKKVQSHYSNGEGQFKSGKIFVAHYTMLTINSVAH